MTETLHIIFIVSFHKKSAPVFTFCLLVFLRSQLSLLHRVAHGAHMLCSSSLCVRLHVCECVCKMQIAPPCLQCTSVFECEGANACAHLA